MDDGVSVETELSCGSPSSPSMPRNKAPAAKSPIVAVNVWWQHIVVVAIEVDIIDQEVDVVENKVGVDFEGIGFGEIGFEEVDLIDLEVDIVENKVGIDFEGIGFEEVGFEEVDIKFEGFEFEEINIEGEVVINKDEFRLTSDIQEDREVA